MDTRDVTAPAEAALTEPEQQVVVAAGTGRLVDLRAGATEQDNPANGASWGAARTVRAELLAELLVGARTPAGGGRLRAVRLAGARITGRLDLEAATLACPLLLWDCHLEQPVILNEARAPAVRLPGCHLPGLAADQLETDGNLGLDSGFTATGEVSLQEAHIGGSLHLSRATLINRDGSAFAADGATVDGAMFGRDGFTARGEVRLVGAHIGGQLDFTEATLNNPNGWALQAGALTVDQDMFCGEGFTATGEIGLLNAHIGGQLDFGGASLTNPDGLALDLEGARITRLLLQPRQRPDGIVNLTGATVGNFNDDQATWPTRLRLRGFAYDVLENDQVGVRARLGWLQRHQGGYTPQPYEQLAAAYRRDGRDEDARRVLIAKQRHRRQVLNPLGKLWNWLLYLTVGYGYRTWLAAVWLAGLLAVGTWVFDRAQMQAAKQPAPAFHPFVYALDRLVPILNLGQKDVWIPQGAALRWSWVLTGAGWVLTTAVVAGLTGVLKRD